MSINKKPQLTRDAALTARPEKVPIVRRDERPNGGAGITLRLTRRPWLRWLTTTAEVERTYGLDPLGREVYDACDGASSVQAIIRKFQAAHKVSPVEAEIAVTTFLKTLLAKGLVLMAVDKDRVRRPE